MSKSIESRAHKIIQIIVEGKNTRFSSVNDLIAYLQPKFSVGPRTIRLSINFATKEGWLEKEERQAFGGPMPIRLSQKLPNQLNRTTKKSTEKKNSKLNEHKDLGFTKIAQLFINKIEEILADQDAKINQQKQKIEELKEIVENIQITSDKADQISERFNKIEKEISEGSQILVDALDTLKGK